MNFLNSLDNKYLPKDARIIFQKGLDNFELEHKIFFLGVKFPLKLCKNIKKYYEAIWFDVSVDIETFQKLSKIFIFLLYCWQPRACHISNKTN